MVIVTVLLRRDRRLLAWWRYRYRQPAPQATALAKSLLHAVPAAGTLVAPATDCRRFLKACFTIPAALWRCFLQSRTIAMSIASVSASPSAAIAQQLQNQAQAQATQAAATAQTGAAGQTAAAAQATSAQQTGQAHHHRHHGGGAPPPQQAATTQPATAGTGGSTVLNTIA
jgi:hypothetical protein